MSVQISTGASVIWECTDCGMDWHDGDKPLHEPDCVQVASLSKHNPYGFDTTHHDIDDAFD